MHANQTLPQGVQPGEISFVLGHPDRQALPIEALHEAAMLALEEPLRPLEYGPEGGDPELLAFLRLWHRQREGLDLARNQAMLIAGATQGVDLVARLLLAPGETVLVESPTYKDSLLIFRDQHCKLHGVKMTPEGIRPSDFETAIQDLTAQGERPRLFYTIPNFQNPTGWSTSLARRKTILKIARRHGILILEDDVYREIAFGAEPPASYFALAGGEGVIRLGSFSKTLAPGFRLGWLLAAPAIIERIQACGTAQMGGGANPFSAAVVAAYCRTAHWEDHIQRLRSIYRTRCETALAALARHMPAGVEWTRPQGGFFLWITLPESMETANLQDRFAVRGVRVAPGAQFCTPPEAGVRCFRLAFSFASLDQLKEGIRLIGEALAEG